MLEEHQEEGDETAAEDHDQSTEVPPGDVELTREIDQVNDYALKLRELSGFSALVNELLQNADDSGAEEVTFSFDEEALVVTNDVPFSTCAAFRRDRTSRECDPSSLLELGKPCDWHAFRRVSGRTKAERSDMTGAYGVGFISVYQITDAPELITAGFHLKVSEKIPRVYLCGDRACPRRHDSVGTTWILPWATADTWLRKKLVETGPVPPGGPVGAFGEAVEAAERAVLFLRYVRTIRVTSPERDCPIRRFGDEDPRVDSQGAHRRRTISGPRGRTTWAVLQKREGLKSGSAVSGVEVALALDGPGARRHGLLHTTLPVEELRLHNGLCLNGPFLLGTGRKTLSLDQTHQGRNEAMLEDAAGLLASQLESLAAELPVDSFWDLLGTAKAQSRAGHSSGLGPFYARLWEAVSRIAPNARIVQTDAGTLITPRECLADHGHLQDRPHLAKHLGITLPSRAAGTAIRRNGLESLGFQRWSERYLKTRLQARGLLDSWRAEEPPAWLDELQSLAVEAASPDFGATIACLPTTDGHYRPAADNHTDEDVPGFLQASVHRLPIVAADKLPERCRRHFTSHFLPWRANQVLTLLEADRSLAAGVIGGVLDWFGRRALDRQARQRLATSEIYPSSVGLTSVSGAFLPQFVDPFGVPDIAVFDMEVLGDHREYLQQLGARTLTLPAFIEEYAGPALAADLTCPQREGFLRLVTRELRQIKGENACVTVLAESPVLPLANSGDLAWVRAADAYHPRTPTAGLTDVPLLAPRCPVPGVELGAWEDLLGVLGVAEELTHGDLLRAAKEIAQERAAESSRALLDALARHSATGAQSGKATEVLERLASEAWLPTVAGGFGRPADLFRSHHQVLVGDPDRVINEPDTPEVGKLLHQIGVPRDVPFDVVQANARAIAASGRAMPSEIYQALGRAAPKDLRQLATTAIIQFDQAGHYYDPRRLYFEGHDIEGYATIVPGDFARRYTHLLEMLGVRQRPDHELALTVLRDAHSAQEGQRPSVKTVRQAWDLLHQNGGIGARTLSELACLPTGGHQLRRPSVCFFADPRRFSERFKALEGRVIKRSRLDATYRAAGVRDLDPFISSHVNPSGSDIDTGLRDWLSDFFPHMARLVLHGKSTGFDGAIANLRAQLQELEVRRADALEETVRLELPGGGGGSPITQEVKAYLDTDGDVPVLYVLGGFQTAIGRSAGAIAVARELGAHIFTGIRDQRELRFEVLESLVRSADPADGEDVLADKRIGPLPELLENPWDPSDVTAPQSHEPVGGSQTDGAPKAQDRAGGDGDLDGPPDAAAAVGRGGPPVEHTGSRAAGVTDPVRQKGGNSGSSAAPTGPVRTPHEGDGSAGPQTGTAPGESSSNGGPKPTHATRVAEPSPPSAASVASDRGPSEAESSDESEEMPLGDSVGGPSEGVDIEPQESRRAELHGRPLEDPEDRQIRARRAAASNPLKVKARRTRSVDVSRPHWDREDSRDYLRREYRDPVTSIPVCQICRYPSSFTTSEGEWYLEAVLFFPDLRHEDVYNRLALCPTCSAKLRFGDSSSRKQMANWARSQRLSPGQAKVVKQIRLAGRPAQITFTADHLVRIKAGLDHHDGR